VLPGLSGAQAEHGTPSYGPPCASMRNRARAWEGPLSGPEWVAPLDEGSPDGSTIAPTQRFAESGVPGSLGTGTHPSPTRPTHPAS
jgi:hypothetical protein